ncbi:MAG: diadenylate cyclase CdaA [Verrucomicrobiales bacterium]
MAIGKSDVFTFLSEHWRSAIEIGILSVLIYYLYLYFRDTRGAQVLTGLAVLFITLTAFAQLLDLVVMNWLLKSFLAFFAIAIVVIFQPELRRALAELGSHRWLSGPIRTREALEHLVDAVQRLSAKQMGALIALEQENGIREEEGTGVALDAICSAELLLTLFHPKTVLHDGGVIVKGSRVVAAGCLFPVSQRENLDRTLGLRHRAGLGITEDTDAIALVVSEETGAISICHRGEIERNLTIDELEKRLQELLLGRRDHDGAEDSSPQLAG